ncbi:hypothetical protein ACNSO8_10645 [Yersinia sp. LJYL362]|uniref:hypothetical protein n=1 Tax=Yersinia sp. LJYL362 TaxID=3402108 RepID=UPI003AB4D0C7
MIDKVRADDRIELPLKQTQPAPQNEKLANEDLQAKRAASFATGSAQILSAKDPHQTLLLRSAHYAGQTLQNWLESYGEKSRVKLNLDKIWAE